MSLFTDNHAKDTKNGVSLEFKKIEGRYIKGSAAPEWVRLLRTLDQAVSFNKTHLLDLKKVVKGIEELKDNYILQPLLAKVKTAIDEAPNVF